MKKRLYYVAYNYADDNGNFGYGDGTINEKTYLYLQYIFYDNFAHSFQYL